MSNDTQPSASFTVRVFTQDGRTSAGIEDHTKQATETELHMLVAVLRGETERLSNGLQENLPKLSSDAFELIVAAATKGNGHIIFLKVLGGAQLTTAGRQFIVPVNPRTTAHWESVLESLLQEGLIEAYKDHYTVTNAGYILAERLAPGAQH